MILLQIIVFMRLNTIKNDLTVYYLAGWCFVGRVIAALVESDSLIARSGRVWIAAD